MISFIHLNDKIYHADPDSSQNSDTHSEHSPRLKQIHWQALPDSHLEPYLSLFRESVFHEELALWCREIVGKDHFASDPASHFQDYFIELKKLFYGISVGRVKIYPVYKVVFESNESFALFFLSLF